MVRGGGRGVGEDDEGRGREVRAILYARVSTQGQADKGYSLAQQLEALRAHAAREGFSVIEEIADPGYSGAYLERPGLDRVRELVEAGGVDVVLAQDRDRFSREPALLWFLKTDLAKHGTALRALNDSGEDTPEAQLTDGLMDQIAKYNRANIARMARRGKLQKAREGKVVASSKINYGFRWNAARDGYEVDEEKMELVRRVFYMIGVEGRSLWGVTSTFEAEGIPAPDGGRRWSRTWVRNLIDPDQNGDLYFPHAYEEVAPMVSPEVAARLVPGERYGIWYYNRYGLKDTRTEKTPDGYKTRRTKEPRPRSEWIAVPVVDAGIPRAVAEAARERMADAYRPWSEASRFNELRGLLRCGVCGRIMVGHRITEDYNYYMCSRTPKSSGPDPCPNRRHRAESLERRVLEAVGGAVKSPDKLISHLDERIKQERAGLLRGEADEESARWAARLADMEQERDGYIRLAATGRITDAELDRYLSEQDEHKSVAERELARARSKQERVEELERDRDALAEGAMRGTDPARYTPNERRELYKRLHLSARVWPDRDLEVFFTYGLDVSDGFRVAWAGSDKYEADRRLHDKAAGLYRADYEAGRVDPKTYHDNAEEGAVPDRYRGEARETFRDMYSLST